jgi:hypothetical protein
MHDARFDALVRRVGVTPITATRAERQTRMRAERRSRGDPGQTRLYLRLGGVLLRQQDRLRHALPVVANPIDCEMPRPKEQGIRTGVEEPP